MVEKSVVQDIKTEQKEPDGRFNCKYGQTMYKVKVFFEHSRKITAEEKLKRVIMADARRISEGVA